MSLLSYIFDSSEREVRKLWRIVAKINALEPEMQSLSDEQLRLKTSEFKERLANGETLDDLLVEAFAVVREAGVRVLKMRAFDVQLIGGMVLHRGSIAEMKTGEGKTLVAVFPLYLNSLLGRGAHLVTPNDYLSRYGVVWMGPIYHFLGVSVGCIRGQSPETGEAGGSYIYDPDYVASDPREWNKLRPVTRKEAYQADITYGTNNEFGFDYLRDNMAYSAEELVQRDLYYAIVDEADSILIDEARTPLIISGIPEEPTDLYYRLDRIVRRLRPETDYTVDEKAHAASFTEEGQKKVEEGLGMPRGSVFGVDDAVDEEISTIVLADNAQQLIQHANAALKAHTLFKKDVDYVVRDGEIIIVDEFTGRLMFGRRYSDGLHQAIEAKENVEIKTETQTVATITFQNYFRLYEKLAGMTGTAKTEEEELRKIYALDVVVIPTNRPMIRKDYPDVVYKTEESKFRGIILEVLQCHARQQPVLVGTRSIEVSEKLSERLLSERLQLLCATVLLRAKLDESKDLDNEEKKHYHELLNRNFDEMGIRDLDGLAKKLGINPDITHPENISAVAKLLDISTDNEPNLLDALKNGIQHSVLNAKYHEQEASIIADAGKLGAVTIATNMAGRGVDIILGGKVEGNTISERSPEAEEVVKVGGLHIIGTERHESRRIDNQLRGRAGRQGDPGSSRFYVSLEDYLWRLFGDKSKSFLLSGWREDQALDSGLLSKVIERAQKKFEAHNFEIRKHVLEYDDVMNVQRERIYKERRKVLEGADLRDTLMDFIEKEVASAVDAYCPPGVHPDDWDTSALFNAVNEIFPLIWYFKPEDLSGKRRDELIKLLVQTGKRIYEDREKEFGYEMMRQIERHFMLDVINRKWREHLANMDFLREGIGLRGYAGVNPIYVYAKEADELFHGMLGSIREEVLKIMYRVQIKPRETMPTRRVYRDLHEGRAELNDPEVIDDSSAVRSAVGRTAVQQRKREKIGRNDPCPCGSGKKYKKCCLMQDSQY